MAKKKKKIKDQMGELVGVAVSPIVATERKKKMSGGKTMKPAKTRYTYNKGSKVNPNEGIEALRKEAPEVVERMGYQEGKEVSDIKKDLSTTAANEMLAPMYVELLQIDETLKNEQGLANIPQTEKRKKDLEQQIKDIIARTKKAEGGEMDSQMTMMMMPEESKEEMDMLPDDQMEDQHLDFIINESLDNEEEMYLMEQLQADERLSMIFDKIMDTATEFSGSGPVEGLGTEVSDSIPARLSDGEFVMTAKATDEIGSDNLERMMKDAEEASDNRQRVAMGGEIEKKVDRFGKPIDEDLTAEEIKRSMLSVNPRLR
tara:strand:- start:3 stop:950 length:948 start_codon:yes stop_codon:yes gene_type:complete